MTIKEILQANSPKLKKITSCPELEAELLLSLAINKSKEFIYTHPEYQLQKSEIKKFEKFIQRRLKSEPIAYIFGKKEFYGLDFIVNKNTLIPRPETEIMVHNVLTIIKHFCTDPFSSSTDSNPPAICIAPMSTLLIDLGTGTGCIPISITKNLPKSFFKSTDVLAIDISAPALNVAKKNLIKHKLIKKIKLLKNNLLSENKILNTFLNSPKYQNIIITANLPYISTKQYQTLSKDIKKYEPKLALVAGIDGLQYYQELFKQIKKIKTNNNSVNIITLIEIEPEQVLLAQKMLNQIFEKYSVETIQDFQKNDRFMIIS
jgi:release factor glutamine methyltransferase